MENHEEDSKGKVVSWRKTYTYVEERKRDTLATAVASERHDTHTHTREDDSDIAKGVQREEARETCSLFLCLSCERKCCAHGPSSTRANTERGSERKRDDRTRFRDAQATPWACPAPSERQLLSHRLTDTARMTEERTRPPEKITEMVGNAIA